MSKGLPKNVKNCLNKARESALLAVETYNKPAVKFKSGGYIVLMCIAWTSLFHAIFFRKKIKPYYREKNSKKFKRINDSIQFWDITKCLKEYYKEENAISKNLDFFIQLRNQIEHQFMPEIDPNIFAECQSLLLNFDKIIEKEFGDFYCIRESLSFALQLFPSNITLTMGNNKESEKVINFIKKYRSSLSSDIINSGDFSFKAILIKVTNHKSKDALPIQFYSDKDIPKESMNQITNAIYLIKETTTNVINKDLLKPAKVVELVQKGIGGIQITKGNKQVDKFNMDKHTRCWKHFNIRPARGSSSPEKTNSKYCIYDTVNQNYLYKKEWVSFLIKEMKDDDKYNKINNGRNQ